MQLNTPEANAPQAPRSRKLTLDELAARKRRNRALAAGLVAFMVIVFLTTILRLQANIAG